ncbi:hypothetical protein [Roseivirga pacifica]|uniref:hypothetical protein n=1 Tax=Roseivirga pacifica TaxID=1267423 RepID=UPI00227B18A2|nr:hypothetical protein [Roseivirga pacifica]
MPHNAQVLNGLKAEKSDHDNAKVKKYTFSKSGAYARLIFSIQIETTAGTSFTQSDNFWVSQVLETANGELDLDKNQLRQEKSK